MPTSALNYVIYSWVDVGIDPYRTKQIILTFKIDLHAIFTSNLDKSTRK